MAEKEFFPVGTGRYYISISKKTGAASGKINLNDSIAREIQFKNGQEVIIIYNKEKREICIKELKY